MFGMRLWFAALTLHAFLSTIECGNRTPHNRRSVGHTNLPVSKGGWRPVVGSGGLVYGPLGTAPLHAPYKIPLVDLYPSSARPVTARDVNKLTSIAQSYRPTTIRTVPVSVSPHAFPNNQPINSYLHQFALPNANNYYKFVQNFPAENLLIRNQHNTYSARPVLQKQQTKPKQQYHNNILHQLTNIQPVQFGQYQTAKPIDIYNTNEANSRPDGKRPQSAETEIFKPEVYKLPDSYTANQYINQPVKTAQQQSFAQQQKSFVQQQQSLGQQQQSFGQQQQSFGQQQQSFGQQQQSFGQQQYFGHLTGQQAGGQKINQYGHPFQDTLANFQQFPPSILGTFGSFGVQSVKARDPYPATKTTYAPQQTTKQAFLNSLNYSPNLFKSTPNIFSTTTPRLTTAQNNLLFGSTLNNVGFTPTQQSKLANQLKVDPNSNVKNFFKPSLQDPFIKNLHNIDYNRVTTYNPQSQHTSTLASPLYKDYSYQSQNVPVHKYDNTDSKLKYNTNKHTISDSVGLTQQVSQQYTNAPGLFDLESSLDALSHRPAYAVVENFSEDIITSASPAAWTVTPQSYSEEAVTQHEKPTTSNPEDFSIVTENVRGYEDTAINYSTEVDSQSRRPLGDDFEPINKNKLKDYYYRVSTPTSHEDRPYRRLKKPTESYRQEPTTESSVNKEINNIDTESLPTLPPSLHFKRPSTQETVDKDRIRKRNKIRRRRPPQVNRYREEISTKSETSPSDEITTTVSSEIHTIRPRIKPTKSRTEPTATTPTVTTELTTSALPTTSPTKPTLIKKKLLGYRRPTTTTTSPVETTTTTATQSIKQDIQQDVIKESSIMKIFSRLQTPKAPEYSYERVNETPDYSHKQDEKDTPTSDVSVSITDTLKTTDSLKEYSFHRDARPLENKETTTETLKLKKENEPTTTLRTTTSSQNVGKIQRPRQKNKLDRPKFSVKDYRSRLNSTTSTTEKIDSTTKGKFPSRKNVYTESLFSDIETTTERKKFTPKEPRHKFNRTENNEQEIHSRHNNRNGQKQNADENGGHKISSRVRNGQRRQKPVEETTEQGSTTPHKRPQRKKPQDSQIGESVQDVSVAETTSNFDQRNDVTSERSRSESAIMKIADKKHQDHIERLFEHSKRVSDLTLAASKDYNTPGMFKTVSSNSRRIPSYFTIATDDPILPIEAFFPQLNQKKES
ncbi:mucin-2-like [Danaus plexippus]|uniref:mucin-2-like n=1 Tax=Danaus plexippus TaxID=13037 RepID=UPI002AB10569|nr:mucin-2-like [Danaus plexippus]